MKTKILEKFKALYGDGAVCYASPGRVNLIGEHTDYNMGFVMPGAIDKAIYVAVKPNGGKVSHVYSIDYDEAVELDMTGDKPAQQWASYVYGVVKEMEKRGAKVPAFDMTFGGDVPLGAGLSSSAALESAVGFALNDTFNLGFSREELAKIGQMTEHNYIGVRCGIMDQFASLFGEKGKIVRLEAGVAVVAKHEPGVESLRDVTMEMLDKYKDEMDDVVYRRCSFVINENQRLLDGCAALEKGDYVTFGQKVFGAHEGLSKWYEVSCKELDFLVDIARKNPGVLGARMMGGGFGGCTINIVKTEAYDAYVAEITEKFEQEFGHKPRVIEVVISQGAHKIG